MGRTAVEALSLKSRDFGQNEALKFLASRRVASPPDSVLPLASHITVFLLPSHLCLCDVRRHQEPPRHHHLSQ